VNTSLFKVGHASALLFLYRTDVVGVLLQPGHAHSLGLAFKVSAGELLVATVRGLLASPAHHAVFDAAPQWQPGGASAVDLVGASHTLEVAVAALDVVIASYSLGATFVFN